MQFTIATTVLFAAAATATTLSYDPNYDDAGRSMSTVACSDGGNGLIAKGYATLGAVPGFPNIGASSDIPGWNSDQCGQCYSVSYNGGPAINVVTVDHAASGMVLSHAAMDKITNGQATFLGRIEATVTKVGVDQCGLAASKRTIAFNA